MHEDAESTSSGDDAPVCGLCIPPDAVGLLLGEIGEEPLLAVEELQAQWNDAVEAVRGPEYNNETKQVTDRESGRLLGSIKLMKQGKANSDTSVYCRSATQFGLA